MFGAFCIVRTIAQFGSALDWGSRGRGFKSRWSDQESPSFRRFPRHRNGGFFVMFGQVWAVTAAYSPSEWHLSEPEAGRQDGLERMQICSLRYFSCFLPFNAINAWVQRGDSVCSRTTRSHSSMTSTNSPMCSIQRFPKMNGRFDCPASLAWKPANALGMMASRLPN
mgnify:CR=1 FL=1